MGKLAIVLPAVALLMGCGKSQPKGGQPGASGTAGKGAQTQPAILAIDYAHVKDGVLYHGTIANLGGAPKATWTFDSNGQKQRMDFAISEANYSAICNAVNTLSDFTTHIVTDPSQETDWKANHVVGVIVGPGSSPKTRPYLIPAKGTSKEFDAWLKLIGLPAD